MQLRSPISTLVDVYISAVANDAADIVYSDRDWMKYKETGEDVRIEKRRRPTVDDLEVYAMFSQTWGSTALGLGGIGGAAMTPAYTVVLQDDAGNGWLVYFGGRFAYRVSADRENATGRGKFLEDINKQQLVSVSKHGRYIGK